MWQIYGKNNRKCCPLGERNTREKEIEKRCTDLEGTRNLICMQLNHFLAIYCYSTFEYILKKNESERTFLAYLPDKKFFTFLINSFVTSRSILIWFLAFSSSPLKCEPFSLVSSAIFLMLSTWKYYEKQQWCFLYSFAWQGELSHYEPLLAWLWNTCSRRLLWGAPEVVTEWPLSSRRRSLNQVFFSFVQPSPNRL